MTKIYLKPDEWITYKEAADRLGISMDELAELNAMGDVFDHKIVSGTIAGKNCMQILLRESDVEHLRKQAT